MSRLRIPVIYLTLLLVSMAPVAVATSPATGGTFTPLQASETVWEQLTSDYPDAIFWDVSFINATHGWVVGQATEEFASDAIVLHTEDGGDSWQLQYDQDRQFVSHVDVLDERTLWINGYGSLFYSLDGGVTWNESVVVGGMAGMSTVKFINSTHGWASNNGILYQTEDTGESWDTVSGYTFDDSPLMIQCLSSTDLWAIGFEGIYHSTDGGVDWTRTSYLGGWALSMVSPTEGWAVSDAQLAHTVDGATWEELVVPMRYPAWRLDAPYCTDVQFIDEVQGWIVGMEISVMYTPDGGANWYEQSIPESVRMYSHRIMAVDFINNTHGWAVGSHGVILRTTAGDSLGNRLWYGMTDPLFLSIVGVVAVVVIGLYVLRRYWTSQRRVVLPTQDRNESQNGPLLLRFRDEPKSQWPHHYSL